MKPMFGYWRKEGGMYGYRDHYVEWHEVKPLKGQSHAFVTIHYIEGEAYICMINGCWLSGWDFPTEYNHPPYTKKEKENDQKKE